MSSADAVTCNFTVNGGSLSSGYKFWKTPGIPSNYYSVNLQISGFSGLWVIYIANGSGNIAIIDNNQSTTNYTFNFEVPASNPSYPNGGGYRFNVTSQGGGSLWCSSNQFYISSIPILAMNLITVPSLVVGNSATVGWSVSGGIPGLSYGGWTGDIRLQWHQNSTALTNLVQVPVSSNSYTFTVPSSIPGGTIPGNNFRISGSNAVFGTSIPGGYVFAYTINFSINLPPPCTPVLTFPSNGSTVTSGAFTVQWSNCNAIRYELLVDNNSGFGSPEISKYHLSDLQNLTQTSYQISGNWLEENVYYWKVYAVYSGGLKIQSTVGSFTYSPTKSTSPNWVPIYRAYKPADVDHFYCTSVNHLIQAIISGYDFEKIDGYLSATPFNGSGMINIFRFYSNKQKSHIYTSNPTTKDSIISADTTNLYEGISGYAYGSLQPGTVKMYYAHLNNGNPILIDHFYTISDVEKNNAVLNKGYSDRGFIAYISPFGDEMTEPWMDMQPEMGYGINPQNGNVGLYNKTSFNIPGARTSLNFMHIYNSLSSRLFSHVNSIGAGWSHSYMATLSTLGGKIYIVWPGGGVHVYNSSDLKPVTKGVYDILTKVSSTIYTVKKKDQFVYTFEILNSTDSTAFLKVIQDRNINTITCNYINSQRKLTSVTSQGRTLFYNYAIPGKPDLISEVIDPLGRNIRFEYDNDNNLIRFTDAKNQITQYQYTQNIRYDHLLKKVIYPKGNSNSIENVYDSTTKRVTYQRSGNTAQYLNLSYNSNSTVVTDEQNKQFTFFYSSPQAGLITSLSRAGIRDSFEYNDNQNPVKPTKTIDGRGYVTTMTYDTKGNPLQINKPENAVHRFSYNSFNDVTQYTDPRNKITTYSYNGSGNLIGIQTPRGSTSINYNTNGTISNFTDPMSRTSLLTYNSYGNVATVTNNMNHQTSYTYDVVSRLLSVTDPNLRTASYIYDNNDNVTRTTKPSSNITNYSYDANDNLYTVSDPNNQTTTFNHNYKDLLENIINPLSNQTSFDYYQNGMLSNKEKQNFHSITYTYDNLNRLQSIGGATVGNFTYDNNDNVVSANNSNGSITYTYDGLNRITSTTDFYGNVVSYSYDQSGNITTITYPGNKTVQYTYYDDNLLNTVKDWNNNTTSYTYRNDGSIQHINYANGTKKTYTYDAAGRVIGISNKKSDGTVINEYNFTLDNVGNHTSVSQTEPLSLPPVLSSSKSFIYNAANRLTSDGSNVYTYDQNGNLTKRTGNDTINLQYDGENRLTAISGKYNAGYLYDVLGNRRYANYNGSVWKYILDVNSSLPKVLMETSNFGIVYNYYIYGNELISRIKADGSTNYFHSDFRGSIVALTDANQTITHKYFYGPFGEILNKNEADPNPFKYVGSYGVMEDATGFYFMRARYYDAIVGRFISEDPVWEANLYVYGDNNPMMNADPDGKLWFTIVEAFLPSYVDMTKWVSNKTGLTEYLGSLLYKHWLSKSKISDQKLDKIERGLQLTAETSELLLNLLSHGGSCKDFLKLKNPSVREALSFSAKIIIEKISIAKNSAQYYNNWFK